MSPAGFKLTLPSGTAAANDIVEPSIRARPHQARILMRQLLHRPCFCRQAAKSALGFSLVAG